MTTKMSEVLELHCRSRNIAQGKEMNANKWIQITTDSQATLKTLEANKINFRAVNDCADSQREWA